jgi:hypothetical protein
MDLCGFPKAAFYIHQAQWIDTRPILHLIPHWNWPDKVRSIFNGLAQVIVQSQPGQTGPLILRAQSAGLQPASVAINVVSAPQHAVVPVVSSSSMALGKWRMSPVSTTAPDPNEEIADNDQNSWAQIQPGKRQPFPGGNFAVFRVRFTPRASVRQAGGKLTFSSLAGRAQIWMDKRLLRDIADVEDQIRWQRHFANAAQPIVKGAPVPLRAQAERAIHQPLAEPCRRAGIVQRDELHEARRWPPSNGRSRSDIILPRPPFLSFVQV